MHPFQLICKRLVIVGTLLIWAIKWAVRPYVDFPALGTLLLGIAPNLLGSFLLPFGAFWLFRRFFWMEQAHQVRLTCFAGCILVTINEFLQLIPVFGRTFDWLDLLFSLVGTWLGYLSFIALMQKHRLATYP